MARNRRKVDGEVTFSWVAVRLLLFVLAVGFLLGITFLKRRNLKMGDELRALDHDLKIAQEKTAGMESYLARCKTPRALEARLVALGLNMVRPQESQIRRLREPGMGPDPVRQGMLAQAGPVRPTSQTP